MKIQYDKLPNNVWSDFSIRADNTIPINSVFRDGKLLRTDYGIDTTNLITCFPATSASSTFGEVVIDFDDRFGMT